MSRGHFQRRHYVTIAKLLHELQTDAFDRGDLFLLDTCERFGLAMIEVFRADNPAFDPDRFQSAIKGE